MFLIDKPRRFKRIFTKYPNPVVQVVESEYWGNGATMTPGARLYTREDYFSLPLNDKNKIYKTYADKIIFACGKEVTEF